MWLLVGLVFVSLSLGSSSLSKSCIGSSTLSYTQSPGPQAVTDGWATLPVTTRCLWTIEPQNFNSQTQYLKIVITEWDAGSSAVMALLNAQGDFLTGQTEFFDNADKTANTGSTAYKNFPCSGDGSSSPAWCDNTGTNGATIIYADESPVYLSIDTGSFAGGLGTGFSLTYTVVTRNTGVFPVGGRPCVYTLGSDLNAGKPSGILSNSNFGASPLSVCDSTGFSTCSRDCYFIFIPPLGAAKVTAYLNVQSSFNLPGLMQWFGSRVSFLSDFVSASQPLQCGGSPCLCNSANCPNAGIAQATEFATSTQALTFHWKNLDTSNWAINYFVDTRSNTNYACSFYYNGQSGNWDDGFSPVSADYHNSGLFNSFAAGSSQPCYYTFNRLPGYRTLTVTLSYWDTATQDKGYWFQVGCYAREFDPTTFETVGLDLVTSANTRTYQADGDVCLVFAPEWGSKPTRTDGQPWKGFGGTWSHSNPDATVGAGNFGTAPGTAGGTTGSTVLSGSSSTGNGTSGFTPPPPTVAVSRRLWWGLNWWATSPQGIYSTGVPNGVFYPGSPFGGFTTGVPTGSTSSGATATTTTTTTRANPTTTTTTATDGATSSTTSTSSRTSTSNTRTTGTTATTSRTTTTTTTQGTSPTGGTGSTGGTGGTGGICVIGATIVCCGSSDCAPGYNCVGAATPNALCVADSAATMSLF